MAVSKQQQTWAGLIERMAELCSSRSPWHRRLWRAGTVELAAEFLDEVASPGVPDAAVSDLKAYAVSAVDTDPGVRPLEPHTFKKHAKKIDSAVDRHNYDVTVLRFYLDEMEKTYLENWGKILEKPRPENIDIEGAARRLTAHIIGSGMHSSSLYSWLKDEQRKHGDELDAAALVHEAHRRLNSPFKDFVFCVPLITPPSIEDGDLLPVGWMNASETSAWKKINVPKVKNSTTQGSFMLKVEARDVKSAIAKAQEQIRVLKSRFLLGSHRPIRISTSMWSPQVPDAAIPVVDTDRRVSVLSYERLGRIYDLEMNPTLDNALSLVAPLRTGPPHIAVVNGWAAVESLLVGASDKSDIVAAERFALVIAASLIRAEFTKMAKSYADNANDSIARKIGDSETNLEKAKVYFNAARAGKLCKIDLVEDRLALQRLKALWVKPREEISNVRHILTREFKRLYRKRNRIVYGGYVSNQGLNIIADRMAPLIGIGLDRFVHAALSSGTSPHVLAARAEARVELLRGAGEEILLLLED